MEQLIWLHIVHIPSLFPVKYIEIYSSNIFLWYKAKNLTQFTVNKTIPKTIYMDCIIMLALLSLFVCRLFIPLTLWGNSCVSMWECVPLHGHGQHSLCAINNSATSELSKNAVRCIWVSVYKTVCVCVGVCGAL